MTGSATWRTLGWGIFCACSWTWVIGMYLPQIMLDRYGWWGFIAFAVPNVLGCAGFGYVARDRHRSRELVERHGAAMTWFSVVTVGYHLLFAVIAVTALADYLQLETGSTPLATSAIALCVLAVLFIIALALSSLTERHWLIIAGVVYAGSLSIFAAIVFSGESFDPVAAQQPVEHALWLLPVLCFGFLLCPYLDLTFHRALQHSPSRHAFAVFGVTFLFMILMTCWMWRLHSTVLIRLVLLHLLLQGVFTTAVHMREIRLSRIADAANVRWTLLAVTVVPAVLYGAMQIVPESGVQVSGSATYLRYLVFYGLLFPLYVWLFVGPPPLLQRAGRQLWWFGVMIVLALPLFEVGFLHHMPWTTAIVVGLLFVWKVVARIVQQGTKASATKAAR